MDEDDEIEGGVVVGQIPTVLVPRHIKKRSLRNKGLTVGFDDKELRDFVTGFHKRKKKRRKEAQRQLKEKERLKRIQARKKRKQERELALYGRIISSENPVGSDSGADDGNDCEEDETNIAGSVPETKAYEDGTTTITVTTSELSHEDEDPRPAHVIAKPASRVEKRNSLSTKKQPLKKVHKHKLHNKGRKKPTFQKKDKKKGKNKR
ncbi:ribosomal RNA-processing protein 17 [Phoenix dactylifera]|uniref:Ribosomal RNA-processing protein 17 n=1 Tax=Phoenix dactylifera TaxID=42345 RepID=A0A8B7BDY7_PHODC|nr:ribosomal RNA-processing protein 17 [Phoenix dactylifera]